VSGCFGNSHVLMETTFKSSSRFIGHRGILASCVCDIKRLGTGKGSTKGLQNGNLAMVVSEMRRALVCSRPIRLRSAGNGLRSARSEGTAKVIVSIPGSHAAPAAMGMKGRIGTDSSGSPGVSSGR